jgi:hypothetical protein
MRRQRHACDAVSSGLCAGIVVPAACPTWGGRRILFVTISTGRDTDAPLRYVAYRSVLGIGNMNRFKASVLAAAVLFGAAVTADAFAQRRHGGGAHRHHHHGHHHHHRGGVSLGFAIGSPFWYGPAAYPYYRPYYSPYYYYPYPAAVGVPASPPVYIEQAQAAPAPTAPAAPAAGYWYYCNESQAYYPHVNQCAGPWERVVPQPPVS